MKYICCVFLFFFHVLSIHSQNTITIKHEDSLSCIGNKITFLEEKKEGLTIKDILKPKYQNNFKPNNNTLFNKPNTSSVYWIKFEVDNQIDEDIWLAIENTLVLTLDLYVIDNLGKPKKIAETGSLRPFNSRTYPIINGFWLPLGKNTSKQTYYLSITSNFAVDTSLRIGTLAELYQAKTIHNNLSVAFVGLMLIMVLYNSFLAYVTKEKVYIFYTTYLISITIASTFLNSYALFEYLTSYRIQYFWHNYPSIWLSSVFLFSSLFCIHFLDLKKNLPQIKRLIEIIIFFQLFVLILNITNLVSIYIIVFLEQFIPSILYSTCLLVSIYLYFVKKQKQAYYYFLGWSFFFLGIILLMFSSNGLIPSNIYIRNASYFGVALEVWMFSLALGNRMKILREEKEKNLMLIKEHNEKLEKKIKKRTKKIEEQKKILKLNNEKLKANEAVLLKSHEKLKDLLDENKLYLQQIEEQRSELKQNNERMQVNQEVLLKSHKKLKLTLKENKIYAQQIEEQKEELSQRNQTIESNQRILMKSNRRLKVVVKQNEIYLEQIEKQQDELVSRHQEILSQNEELSIINEKLEEAQLKQKELNNLKDRIFSIISHDLNAPLNSIYSFLDLFLHFNILSETDSRKIAEDLYQTVENTSFLLANLLNWARNQMDDSPIQIVQVKLDDIVSANLNLFKNIAEAKSIQLIKDIDQSLYVWTDKDMLDFIIRNILSNAIKFTPKNGQIEINGKAKSENFVEIEIRDSGVGIPKESIRKLFSDTEHISTVGTANEKGTGLGLKVSKEYVERNGGNIWVESEIGKGTSFYFTVPLTESAQL